MSLSGEQVERAMRVVENVLRAFAMARMVLVRPIEGRSDEATVRAAWRYLENADFESLAAPWFRDVLVTFAAERFEAGKGPAVYHGDRRSPSLLRAASSEALLEWGILQECRGELEAGTDWPGVRGILSESVAYLGDTANNQALRSEVLMEACWVLKRLGHEPSARSEIMTAKNGDWREPKDPTPPMTMKALAELFDIDPRTLKRNADRGVTALKEVPGGKYIACCDELNESNPAALQSLRSQMR